MRQVLLPTILIGYSIFNFIFDNYLKFYCFSEFKICFKITGSHRMGNLG